MVSTWYHDFNLFTEEVFNVMNARTGLYWTSNTHCGNYVPIYAIGVGATNFAPMSDNTEIAKKIMSAK